jgi:hypothetical protein
MSWRHQREEVATFFLSLFPLVLGYTLEGDPALQHALLSSALHHLPIIGPQLQRYMSLIHGSRMGVTVAGACVVKSSALWPGSMRMTSPTGGSDRHRHHPPGPWCWRGMLLGVVRRARPSISSEGK